MSDFSINSSVDSTNRDVMLPDFSGIPDFHKSIISITNWKDLASYCCFNNDDAVSALS